jgi:two-component system response regulator RegA
MIQSLPIPRRPRVLVVDDEPRLRALMMDVIPEMGFEVSAAHSAEEGLRLMEQKPHEIALLDLQLPLLGGMDLFAMLRQRWPQVQVVVMTGFGDLSAAQEAIRLDVVDFLSKPCHLHDIEQALDRARRRLAAPTPTPSTPLPAAPTNPSPTTLAEHEKQQILDALSRNNGNRTQTARDLGISRRTLHYRLQEYREKTG